MSYHENMIFQLLPWKPLDHVPLRNPLVPDVRITAGRSRGFLEPYPSYVFLESDMTMLFVCVCELELGMTLPIFNR